MRATLLFAAACAIAAPTAYAAPAAHTWDLATFTAPDGFTFEEQGDHAALKRVGAKSYCVIGVFDSADAAGDLQASFAAEWKNVVLVSIDPVDPPPTQAATIGGQPALVGGAMSTTGGKPVLAVLSTIDAGTKVVAILVLTPGPTDLQAYTPSIQALLNSVTIRRVDPAPAPAPAPAPVDDQPAAPSRPGPPPSTLSVADLGGQWNHDDGAFTNYVSASTGSYAGYDSVQYKEQWTIDAKKATALAVFHGVSASSAGAYQVNEKHTYKVALGADGELTLTEKGKSTTHYLVRGWKVMPDRTFLVINGPYVDVPIPDQIRNDPNYGGNLNETWVRVNPKSK